MRAIVLSIFVFGSNVGGVGGADKQTVGSIQGTIIFAGAIPQSPPDDAGVRRDLLEVDGKTRGLRNVVVYLMSTNGGTLRSPVKSPAERTVVDQQDYAFTPRVAAVRAGEPVLFKNSDPANHNVRTTATTPSNEFNVFTGADGQYEHRFAVEPRYRPVRLGCDIHPWMRAWIYVFDHPHFAITDSQGRFRIRNVPVGTHKVMVQQPDVPYSTERTLKVSADAPAKLDLEIRPDERREKQ